MTGLLQDRVAVVTGGVAGIGKAIALHFAEQGAKLALMDVSPGQGGSVVEELRQKGCPQVSFFQVDVSKTQEVHEAIDKIVAEFGTVDILVNNAGITRDSLLMRMKEADWDAVVDVNLKACFNTCQAVLRPMMKARRGKIINISSVVGLTGNPGQVNYASSKAGMVGFSKSLAKEVGSRNICINCIAPGWIQTRMTEALPAEKLQAVQEHIALGRLGVPNDIAQVAVFLASAWSDYVTGQVIVVDGGLG